MADELLIAAAMRLPLDYLRRMAAAHPEDEAVQLAVERLQQRTAPETSRRRLVSIEPQETDVRTSVSSEPPALAVKVDPELARLAVAMRLFPVFRLWSYAHTWTSGAGWIEKERLFETLKTTGVVTTRRTFNHLLHAGANLFWTVGLGRGATPRVYLTGYVALAQRLTALAMSEHRELVETNRPGARKVYVDLSGGKAEVVARLQAAWLALRGEVTISRQRLQLLWRCSKNTLLKRERRAGITSRANFAQHHDPHAPEVPKHAYLIAAGNGRSYASWRLPNTYSSPDVERLANGQRRKARTAANAAVESHVQAVNVMADGLLRTGRLYFTDKADGPRLSGFRSLGRHIRRHGDLDVRHYARLGDVDTARGVVVVFECSTGDCMTDLKRDWQVEQTPAFAAAGWRYRLAWQERA
jgi:hypothetical protein